MGLETWRSRGQIAEALWLDRRLGDQRRAAGQCRRQHGRSGTNTRGRGAGRELFASKGCVVCHAINEVGGTGAAPLDPEAAPGDADALDFVARMWRGAEAMIFMQQQELGVQIDFTGQELADIIAFVHHPTERRKFSEEDFPALLRREMRDQ